MPLVSRLAIRLALLHLVVAVGGWALLPIAVDWTSTPIATASRAVWHLLAVGWLTQLILGVAYWLFPTHKVEPKRGSPRLAGLGLGLLNVGLVLRVIFEPAWFASPQDAQPALIASAVCQVVGIVAFVVVLWPRVRGK